MGRPRKALPVDPQIRDAGREPCLHRIPDGPQPRGLCLDLLHGQAQRLGETDGARDILRAGPNAPLLSAAEVQRLQASRIRRDQGAGPRGSVDLVPGDREQIDGIVPKRQRDLSHGLDRVAVQHHGVLTAELRDGRDRELQADLVVHPHARHHRRPLAHGRLERIQVEDSIAESDHRMPGTLLRGLLGSFEHGGVFDRGGDHQRSAAAPGDRMPRSAKHRQVVRFGPPTGKEDVGRRDAQSRGRRSPCPLQAVTGPAAPGVAARRVPEVLRVALRHRGDHFGADRRGGGVVEVDGFCDSLQRAAPAGDLP